MKERTSNTLKICRRKNVGVSIVATILISEGSTRNFHLMEHDYVKLDFTLKNALHFRIGDYIEDPIFGKFVLTSEQMPAYNQTTGGYDYSLRFDAYYYLWKNKLFMLTANNEQNTRVRKETDWCLTDKLSVHLDEIIHNLTLLGYTGYSYSITAEKAAEVRFIEYNGVDIITALKMIAESWETEWWVKDKVIHLGKCEGTNTPYDMELGVNVESMDIRNNVNEFANKIYAYGSTRNLPFSYRKDLVFQVTDASNGLFRDANRDITLDMISGVATQQALTFGTPAQTENSNNGKTFSITWLTSNFEVSAGGSIQGDIRVISHVNLSSGVTGTFKVTLGRTGTTLKTYADRSFNVMNTQLDQRITIDDTLVGALQYLYLEVTITISSSNTNMTLLDKSINSSVVLNKFGVAGVVNLTYDGNTYPVTFNPNGADNDSIEARYFSFNNGTPSGFGVGSQYTLDGLKTMEIPSGYYTTKYNDPSSLAKLGEVRLELPESTGGFVATSGLQPDQIVERVVIWENIFPHAVQMVSDVTQETQMSEEKQQDGTSVTWAWIQYHLLATLANGNPFVFNTDYISDGIDSLQIKFLTEAEMLAAYPNVTPPASAEYRLAGMTFNVNFDNTSQTYTIARNTDYGAKLPNETLKPSVGDPFVLIGWNVKAMETLGLITTAESALQTAANEYLSLMEQDQFNFANTMMSDWMFDLGAEDTLPFYTSEDEPLYDDDDYQFYVKQGDDYYIMPLEGTRVTIKHNALSADKTSRIIGYEFKLDKPYDSPRYDVGETDAYSRLKQIEKQITKY